MANDDVPNKAILITGVQLNVVVPFMSLFDKEVKEMLVNKVHEWY